MAENEVNKTHTVSQSPMKRYFLVSFCHQNGFGGMSLVTEGVFPSIAAIRKLCSNNNKPVAETILNIFEFQSETDYNQFIRE